MDIYEVRRRNLLELVASKFEGNRSSFSRFVGKNVNMINLCLTLNEDLRRNIGEKMARELETLCSMPEGWMDEDRNKDSKAIMTHAIPRAVHIPSTTQILGDKLHISEGWLQSAFPTIKSFSSLSFHIIPDDTMEPSLFKGDIIFLDGAALAEDPGVFLIRIGNQVVVRRFCPHFDGTVAISADNNKYSSMAMNSKEWRDVSVIGKALGSVHYTPM